MIVRLKDGNRRGKRRIEEAFQFYDSSIKRNTMLRWKFKPTLFQFYDSPIKSCSKNSACTLPSTFQFYDSPIKSHPLVREILARYGFQFYDSPIKSIPKPRARSASPCFNSMIVRLKVPSSNLSIPEQPYVSIL